MKRDRTRRRAAGGESPRRGAPTPPARRGAPAREREGWSEPWWFAPTLAILAAVVLQAKSVAAPFFADDWLFLDLVRSRSLVSALMAHDPIGNFFRPLGRAVWFWLLAHASRESPDRKSTRLNSSHTMTSRMPSSA